MNFWLEPNSVPGRVALGVTTLLTLTTLSVGVRQSLPPVSYVKVSRLYKGAFRGSDWADHPTAPSLAFQIFFQLIYLQIFIFTYFKYIWFYNAWNLRRKQGGLFKKLFASWIFFLGLQIFPDKKYFHKCKIELQNIFCQWHFVNILLEMS